MAEEIERRIRANAGIIVGGISGVSITDTDNDNDDDNDDNDEKVDLD
jgi:hypothetical protein